MEDEKLETLLDEKFSEMKLWVADQISGQISGVNTRMDAGFRRVGVELEQLNHSMQQNNELIHAVDEKLESFRAETKYDFKTTRGLIGTSNAGLLERIGELAKTRS